MGLRGSHPQTQLGPPCTRLIRLRQSQNPHMFVDMPLSRINRISGNHRAQGNVKRCTNDTYVSKLVATLRPQQYGKPFVSVGPSCAAAYLTVSADRLSQSAQSAYLHRAHLSQMLKIRSIRLRPTWRCGLPARLEGVLDADQIQDFTDY